MNNGVKTAEEKTFWMLHNKRWTLPIEVRAPDGTDVLQVVPWSQTPPFMLGHIQQRLAAISSINNESEYFQVDELRKVAEPIPDNVTPEQVVRWEPAPLDVKLEYASSMDREFFEDFTHWTTIKNVGTAVVLWRWFCQQMMDWLVNKERPVDLGFAVLVPLPLRTNWKEILASRNICQKSDMEKLKDPHYLWYDQHSKCALWSVSILYKPLWYRLCRARGQAQRSHGIERYRTYVRETVEKITDRAWAIYRAYLAEIRFAGLDVFRRIRGRDGRVLPNRRNLLPVEPTKIRRFPHAVDVRRKRSIPRPIATLETEDERLSEVRRLQHEEKDVRDAWKHLG